MVYAELLFEETKRNLQLLREKLITPTKSSLAILTKDKSLTCHCRKISP